MGRREQRAGGIEAAGEPPGRAWQAVRRALGRLASSVAVRDLTRSEMRPPVAVRAARLDAPPLAPPGGREQGWEPTCAVRPSSAPQAVAGTRGGAGAPDVRLAEESAALAPPAVRRMPAAQAGAGRTESADLLLPAFVVRLPDSFLSLPADPVQVRPAALLASVPGGPALEGWGVRPPRCRALRLPRVPDPRVRWGGDAVLGRISLTRRGLEPPPGVPFARAFGAEERRLAEALHLPPGDVTLVGVYPGVPILAVSRLVVADGGQSLRLWLKPDVLRGRGGMRLITLLVGRQTSSGKMLQAAL